jgi:hypothetical protein
MATSEQGFIERLIDEEITRLVADAIKDGGIVSASECATQILLAYRGSALSKTKIANRVMMAAASAGVAVEFGQLHRKIRPRAAI